MVFEAPGNEVGSAELIESTGLESVRAAEPTPEAVSVKNQLPKPLPDSTTPPSSSIYPESHFFLGGERSHGTEPADGADRLWPFGSFTGIKSILGPSSNPADVARHLQARVAEIQTLTNGEPDTHPHNPWKTGPRRLWPGQGN